jgi:hypothetical protein
MEDSHIDSVQQIKELLKVEQKLKFKIVSKKERNSWLENSLSKFGYFSLSKKDKGAVKQYLLMMTGLSRAQLTKLIGRKKRFGKIFIAQEKRCKFATVYAPEDIALLIKTDNAHERLSGKATKRIFQREYEIFGRKEYKKLSQISVSHLYNLRKKRQYQSGTLFWQKTKPTPVNIGERRRPDPQGRPGFIRVDTVHQGDLDKEKGVYHINLVDEVTQWELVVAVSKISEYFLEEVLEKILSQFPFRVINFHSDNGSEYINKIVARLLNKLLIKQTKSRARHSNDNALAECKNGWVIRKHMGRNFIPQKFAPQINEFYQSYLNPYLNFHRPCGFASLFTDKKGKIKKKYDIYMTPYEKLKSLPEREKYLKLGITFVELDKIAYEKSDNEFAALMQKAKVELFKQFRHHNQLPTVFASPAISGSFLD